MKQAMELSISAVIIGIISMVAGYFIRNTSDIASILEQVGAWITSSAILTIVVSYVFRKLELF